MDNEINGGSHERVGSGTGAAHVPEVEWEEMPMCECGWCGEPSPMRVDADLHPLDVCPHCETEGFMRLLSGGEETSASEPRHSATS